MGKMVRVELGTARQTIRALVAEFPDAPALTLAKRAYREAPELWPSLEACRSMVRVELGVCGDKQRKQAADKTRFRKPRDWSDCIPASFPQHVAWGAMEIPGPAKVLVISDVHLPYHSVDALQLALEHGEQRKADVLLLNGDIVDHFALSRWEPDPRRRSFPEEVAAAKSLLSGLRKRFPKARIVYKLGNHEERYERYLRLKAPDLLGLPGFAWEEVFDLKANKVELVDGKRPVRLGQLNVLHGHEYVFQISNPVNPARGLFLRAKSHVLGGHFHQTSQHSERSLENKVVSSWSTGCLCELHPEYRPLNNWNHGFAFVEIDKGGAFHVDNLRIVAGKVW